MPYPMVRVLLALLLAALPGIAFCHSPQEAAAEMAASANRWLDSLSEQQREAAQFAVNNPERENWHYIPKAREGLPLAKMTEPQRKLAHALLASGLSEHGLLQADAVIALEQVLRQMEGAAHRDDTLYYFTVFGRPSPTATWGWRVEGHHLSVNFTIANGTSISATPNFVGANPAEVRIAHEQQGRRALAAEEDLGRALVLSLNDEQRSQAIIAPQAPGDILTRNDAQAKSPEAAGLGYAAMSPDQQQHFRALVALYANRLRPDVADAELNKIAATGWNRLRFAWAGSTTPKEGHYYRIQSPDFVIEYDNTQNHANHIHTVWRDYQGDFGRDLLKEHYSESHK
jgi:hypothetical protein